MSEPFGAASHHDVLLLVVRIGLLLLAARTLGELALRAGQPAVVGELLAGMLLGPTILGALWPAAERLIVPQTPLEGHLLEVVSLLGALLLMLATGLETDLAIIRRHARTALGVSAGGVCCTFASGYLLGLAIPDDLLAQPDKRLIFALFMATAMSISAIPVIAKVLLDLRLMRRDIGQTIIAAGLCDDTTGWILLSVVSGLAAGATVTVGSVAATVGRVAAFMLVSWFVARPVISRTMAFVQDHANGREPTLTLALVAALLWGAVSQALHLEAVLGAFVMGILLGQMRRLPRTVHEQIETLAIAVFAPIFFATAGLKVDLAALRSPRLLLIACAVVGVACAGKVVGTYLGARLIGRRPHWTALAFGASLNARGAMEIIIATIGLRLGILTQEMFSIVVLMAITTSLMAPPALRWVLTHIKPTPDELARMRAEERAADSLLANLRRLYLPVRTVGGAGPEPSPDALAATRGLETELVRAIAADQAVDLTLLTVVPPGQRPAGERNLNDLRRGLTAVRTSLRVVESMDPANAILQEAQRGQDLMVLGASHRGSSTEVLFNPIVDYLLRFAPCPTLVVRAAHGEPAPWPPRRILVRANGTAAARQAAEVAFALAGEETDDVILLHVVVPGLRADAHLDPAGEELQRQLGIGHTILHAMSESAVARGLPVDLEVRIGAAEEQTILEVIDQRRVDLLVVGTHLRPASEKLYLGVRVERLLREAPCAMVVVNTP